MSISVILADDHTIFREGLMSLLQTATDLVLLGVAANGRDAWHLIEQLRPNVAILDIAMPEMTGTEVTRRTHAAGLTTEVALLTACADPCTAMEAEEAGAVGYVLKDHSFEELIMAVQTIAAGGTFMTPVIRAKLREMRHRGRTMPVLSSREREVVCHIAQGRTGKEIARNMGLSPRTVDTYRGRLMEKLEAHTIADVVRYALKSGLVD
jgi:DNA-binding NarL/FixJ family response regulator